jgi:hypothetical protein
MAPSAIVVGASGSFGPSLVQALISHKSSFNRIAILSAPEKTSKFTKYEAQGVEIVVGSYTDAASYKGAELTFSPLFASFHNSNRYPFLTKLSNLGFDVVVSLAGNAIMADQPKMIDAAIAAGARHFIPSEYGVDISNFPTERYFRDKHITRNHLRAKAEEVPGFKFTLVLIGTFAETFALSPVFGVDAKEKKFNFYGDPETEYSFSSMSE